jgi:uncharacterized protein (TIRG00374 family)
VDESVNSKELRKLNPVRIILPAVLGLGIIVILFYRDYNKIDFNLLNFTLLSGLFLFFAVLMVVFRDLGYILRIRILSSGELTWIQCLKIVFLWEFGSAITPSAIGGTALATIFLWKEGLSIGKSTSIVLSTSFLDELYFSLMFPFMFIIFSKTELFNTFEKGSIYNNLFLFAISGYSLKLLWTLLVGYSLFINPKFFAEFVKKLFKLRFLKKWKNQAEKMAIDFEIANKELKSKSLLFWVKSFSATFISWTGRYFVLNFIFVALILSTNSVSGDFLEVKEHLMIFARQLIMWIMMIVLPSPGGSGFVETIFAGYMADFVPIAGFSIVAALIWRLLTYYPYLIIGSIIAPTWISKNLRKNIKK